MAELKLDRSARSSAAQCSGALDLAKLGLLANVPACTDTRTKPWVEEAGVQVLDQPSSAPRQRRDRGRLPRLALPGGVGDRAAFAGWKAAESVVHYVRAGRQKQEFVQRAAGGGWTISPARGTRRSVNRAKRPRSCSASLR
jgi:hypothetical protein